MESRNFDTAMDNKLIQLIKSRPALYKSTDQCYKDRSFTRNAWKEVSIDMKKSVLDCKTRWRTIRDTYKKIKKKQSFGSKAFSRSKYNDEKLKFLDEYLFNKKPSNNIVYFIESNYENSEAQSESVNMPSILSCESVIDSSSTLADVSVDFPDPDSSCVKHYDASSNFSTEESVPEDTKKEIFIGTYEKHLNAMKTRFLGNKIEEEHPIQTFFRSMASTVMTFPIHLIAEARMEVCNIVSKMEVRALSEK